MDDRPWLKHYDANVPHSLAPYPDQPAFAFLEQAAAQWPDRPCTVFKGRALSYRAMNALTDRLAAGLAALGVQPGDRVGLFLPNLPQFVLAYYGILKAGAVVVATNPLYTPPEIERQLQDSGVKVMVVMSGFYDRLKAVQPKTSLQTIIVTNLKEQLPPLKRLLFTLFMEQKGGHRATLAPGDVWLTHLLDRHTPAGRPARAVSGDDVALFQYSGGTTGTSKAAIATHASLVANTLQIKSWLHDIQPGREVTLMAIPLFHVYGMVAGMSLSLAAGATMIMVPNPRDLADLLESVNRYQPTIFPGVPLLYNAINRHPGVQAGRYRLGSIRACISGSEALLVETKRTFERLTGGKLFEGYGLSEAPTATHCNPFLGQNKAGSIGLPFPDVECRVVSLEDGETVLGPGQAGELILRGPQVFKGYWNMPGETRAALRPDPDGRGPWLYTGDVVRMDEDGYFYILDRKKELIKVGGYQVWPREVEEVLSAHPHIQEVGVAGVPDPTRGEVVKAWVVPVPGRTLTADEIRAFGADKLARYKLPSEIEFRDELPKTTVGKVLRRELVRQHLQKVEARAG